MRRTKALERATLFRKSYSSLGSNARYGKKALILGSTVGAGLAGFSVVSGMTKHDPKDTVERMVVARQTTADKMTSSNSVSVPDDAPKDVKQQAVVDSHETEKATGGSEAEHRGHKSTILEANEAVCEGGRGEESSSGTPAVSSWKRQDDAPPGRRVVIVLEDEVVEDLPVMTLEEVRACDGMNSSFGGPTSSSDSEPRLLATFEGFVYDVTSFADHHPGGRELLRTAAGLDLSHFFENYTVHGASDKAAEWLAPLVVGKLSPSDAAAARHTTTPAVHVAKRMRHLGRARRRVLCVASTLPVWLVLRGLIRAVGELFPSLARLLARVMPVTVPGYSKGAEPIDPSDEASLRRRLRAAGYDLADDEACPAPRVAVIGGGIAGCGAAWALKLSGFDVTLFEARKQISGNARTFDWEFPMQGAKKVATATAEGVVKSCVSVTAWPPLYYKNYTALLQLLNIETVPMPLSWFLNSKVEGCEGTLWGADPRIYEGSLRSVFAKDFAVYRRVEHLVSATTDLFCLKWAPWKWGDSTSMYANHTGLGLLNPLNVVPLYSLFKIGGGSDLWWDVVFTPYYTASFLVDELRPFPAVFGPLIEAQIPLNPIPGGNTWQGSSDKAENDCHITTCVSWKDAGVGIRAVFAKLVEGVTLQEGVRVREVVVLPNGQKRVYDEHDKYVDVDRVIFACPSNAVGNILKKHTYLEDVILSTPVYADDHHPATGHMHAVMHSDSSVIDPRFREECVRRASNYVEVTRLGDGSLNIENQYNFGVQTPGPGVYDLPLDEKPVMLISHALGEGKHIDPALIRGTGNHARAHPLYSGWNVAAMLSLRLVQGRDGCYYCSNWTTPGNCHDMSLLSGLICAHAVGARYPFEADKEAKKDFYRLKDLMGV